MTIDMIYKKNIWIALYPNFFIYIVTTGSPDRVAPVTWIDNASMIV